MNESSKANRHQKQFQRGDDNIIAHVRKTDQVTQSAETHCKNVAHLAAINGKIAGVEKTAELAGILHDMGKFTLSFEDYIINGTAQKGEVHHSPTGAIFAYNRWFFGGNEEERPVAQIVSMVIRGHHGGLLDCVDFDGNSPYLSCMKQDLSHIYYNEAVENYLSRCCSEKELDELFEAAKTEINVKLRASAGRRPFVLGMLARLILSLVVDADRWDTACFEAGVDPFERDEKVDWPRLTVKLEEHVCRFSRENKIGLLRGRVSDLCVEAAKNPTGVYTLTVPTGGGKTLSSLRFALKHADNYKMSRIFYVIPYNTILEQNAADIREALGGYEGILEHYGTFTSASDGRESELEEAKHTLMSERWNVPIILTSMVQFLDAAFHGGNTSARRFNRLAQSVIVFDEIQALPKHCTVLFERLVKFLSADMGCTVLLCTATQPSLKIAAEPLLPEAFTAEQSLSLKRTEVIDESDDPKNYDEAASKLAGLQRQLGAVLVVVNTKDAAKKLFERTLPLLEKGTCCVHLSTAMCPAHRLDKLKEMKLKLGKEPVFCVSTMLIEAGVNISFPCVVRSLAGLPNIIQAAGRCNRHMEMGETLGKVYIWQLSEERLSRLPEISMGQRCTRNVKTAPNIGGLDTAEAMEWYFKKERLETGKAQLKYLWKEKPSVEITLTDMLTENEAFWKNVSSHNRESYVLKMKQAFATAGRAFQVIEQDTVPILVPYDRGQSLISDLCGNLSLKEKIRLMREAQIYSVSTFRSSFISLIEKGVVYQMGDSDFFAVREEYYDKKHLGLSVEPSMADFLNY